MCVSMVWFVDAAMYADVDVDVDVYVDGYVDADVDVDVEVWFVDVDGDVVY